MIDPNKMEGMGVIVVVRPDANPVFYNIANTFSRLIGKEYFYSSIDIFVILR